jgi:hypothetical protein
MASNQPPSSAASSSLYGIQRPKHSVSQKDLTSSSTLAFTTHLSSLIAKDASSTKSHSGDAAAAGSSSHRGRSRPSKTSTSKSDIFAVHNKGAQKRAAADEADEDAHGTVRQVHQSSANLGQVDAATLHRSKRRMEEKVRMYEELRRGEHLADGSSSDEEEEGVDRAAARMRRKEKNALVDFDRKWAEEEAARGERGSSEDEDNDDDDNDTGSLVEYEDEFGRARQGTKAEASRVARLKRRQHDEGEGGQDAGRSRPARPADLIYGDAIQTQAFNPDASLASQMSYLASRRDRSATPPEGTHYDAEAEVRTRGTGFYAFSRDQKLREQEMEALVNARRETERERAERNARRAERERLKDERRKIVHDLRGKRQAERFLQGLGSNLAT